MPETAKRIVWAPRADQDLIDIWRYLARNASLPVADDAIARVYSTVERLRERSLIGRPRNDVLPELRSILVEPYVVFHRVGASSVDIVRVLHERRSLEKAFGKKD